MEYVIYFLVIIVVLAGSFLGGYVGATMKVQGIPLPTPKLGSKNKQKDVMEEIGRINQEFEEYLYDNEGEGEDIG